MEDGGHLQVIDEKDSILVGEVERYYDSNRTSGLWVKACLETVEYATGFEWLDRRV
jgi:hypothetical protein